MAKKVYRLTESQFEKVVENSLNKLNEQQNKELMKEYGENPIVTATGEIAAATGLLTWATKSIYSSYKSIKASNPQLSPTQTLLQALSQVANSIANAKNS